MSTDSSNFFPNTKAVSSSFNYTPKPSAVSGRSYRVSVPSSNQSSFTPNQTMIFQIPCGMRSRTFLDPTSSYIRFSVKTNVATGASATCTTSALGANLVPGSTGVNSLCAGGAFVDHNAYSFFNTSTLYSSSNMIEYINNCNILYSYILDTNFSYSNALTNSLNYGMYVPTIDPLEIRKGTFMAITPVNAGDIGGTASAASAAAGAGEVNTFCAPILSGILGIGSSGTMIPVYAIADVLRLEILLETASLALVQLGDFTGGTTPTYTIINAELELNYVELSQEGQIQVLSSYPAGSPIFMCGNSYRHYVQTIPSGTTGIYSCLVPSKLASLKSLHCLPRLNTTVNDPKSYSLSSRINPYFDYVSFKISGMQFPQKPITLQNTSTTGGFTESYLELLKCFQNLLSTDKGTLINATNYNVAPAASTGTNVLAAGTTTNSFKNAFAVALDLELFTSKDSIITGLNCLSESVFFEANISATSGAAVTLDFYSIFDNLFIIDQTGYISSRA